MVQLMPLLAYYLLLFGAFPSCHGC